ncbi:hypothetical protein CPB86DRAFT_97231 [Serendipita vermifera]|nr:hypothetical protein CPB86DRAFT_97231 [Serendipita vermifera]
MDGGYYINGNYVPSYEEYQEYVSTREPWASNIKYGRFTLYFCGASLGLFFFVHVFKKALFWYRMRNPSPPSYVYTKFAAMARLLTYPRLPYYLARFVNHLWAVGPLGPNIMLFLLFVFTSFYCWINKYYYRPPFYGSPPVSLRSEWIAVALLPFLFVLGSKRNVISWMTGVSYDKLQVLHQGLGFMVLYMSLVHAITQVVQSKMELPWTVVYASSYIWWTGFAALGPLIWLYLGSLPFVRRRLYEPFYGLHVVAAILFIGFLYMHGFSILDTNAYMNATIALFGFGIFARLFMMVVSNVMFRHRAQLSIQGGWIRAKILTKMHWAPGTHVFVRFAKIRPLESHPFTIYSIPSSNKEEPNEMILIIRPENGFTHVLAKAAEKSDPQDEFLVILDGPYGEVGYNTLRSYENVLLLAAGTGVTFVAPILFDLVLAMKQKEGTCLNVELIWVVRHNDDVKWFESDLLEAKKTAELAGGTARIKVHVTGRGGDEEKSLDTASAEKDSSESKDEEEPENIVFFNGRPDVPSLISSKGNSWTGRVGVAVCGPLSFITDTSNAVASVQLDILRGQASCAEMYLRSEGFGW